MVIRPTGWGILLASLLNPLQVGNLPAQYRYFGFKLSYRAETDLRNRLFEHLQRLVDDLRTLSRSKNIPAALAKAAKDRINRRK